MNTIFIFTRPFVSRFTSQYRAVSDRWRFLNVSDFKYRDDVGLITRQYHHLRHSDVTRDRGFDYETMARRCRFLRRLEPGLQRRLINAAWLAIDDVCVRHRPVAFIGLPMDNYFLDLFDQYCAKAGIVSTFPVQSFLPERTRITSRGEYVPVRTPSEDEVAHYRDMLLQRNFRPTWLSKKRTSVRLVRMYGREIAKIIFFGAAKRLKRDPYSFHYNGVYPVGATVNPNSLETLRIKDLYEPDLDKVSALAARYSRAVFLPLQFSPESSLDYNIADSRFSKYEALLDTILGNLPDDVLLLVKEHPDMYGYRQLAFYNRFLNRPNVMLVDVNITVQQVFRLCQYVLVTGGASTGAEAVVKGQTVISLGGAFYGGNGTVHEIFSFDDVARWPEWLRPIVNAPAATDAFIRQILSNTLIGPYDFVRIKRSSIPIARANALEILRYIEGEVATRAAEPHSVAAER